MLLNAEDRKNRNNSWRSFPAVIPLEWPEDLQRFVFNRIDECEENITSDDVLNIAEWLYYDHYDQMPASWIDYIAEFIDE